MTPLSRLVHVALDVFNEPYLTELTEFLSKTSGAPDGSAAAS